MKSGFNAHQSRCIADLLAAGYSAEAIAGCLNCEISRVKKSIASRQAKPPIHPQDKPKPFRQKPVPPLSPEERAIALRHPGWAWMAGELAKDGTEVVDRYLAIAMNPCPTAAHTKGARKSC